jgi:hypothetical protein
VTRAQAGKQGRASSMNCLPLQAGSEDSCS